MGRRIAAFGVCFVAIVTALAWAQEGGGARRGGFGRGGFGPGGFGPGGPPGMAGSAVMLLGIPEVRQEIAVRDEQQKALDQLLAETQDHADSATYQPDLRASTALHPDSELIPVSRANGILAPI